MTRLPLSTVLFVLLLFPAGLLAQGGSHEGAGASSGSEPRLADGPSALERAVPEALSPDQLNAYLNGKAPEAITLSSGESLADFLDRKGADPNFTMSWILVSSGGATAGIGGDFSLASVVGQPIVGRTAGGNFVVSGGVLGGQSSTLIFEDGFENGGLSSWSSAVGQSSTVAQSKSGGNDDPAKKQ